MISGSIIMNTACYMSWIGAKTNYHWWFISLFLMIP